MKSTLLTAVATVVILTGCTAAATQMDSDEEEWTQLFNGENLDGWDFKITGYELNDNYNNTFRVEDGMLRVVYDEYETFDGDFGHIFYHQPFSHYMVAVEYRFVGEQAPDGPGWAFRNNGIMFHSQSAETMGLHQDFPISIEAQLLGGDGENDRPTLAMCSPGTHVVMDGELITQHCVSPTIGRTFHGDQWVRVELLVLGDSLIHHMVNDEVVMEYSKPQIGGGQVSNYDPEVKRDGEMLTEGYIALQAESHPTDFRRIEVLNLRGCMDPQAANYKSYYVEPEDGACEF